MKRFFLVCGLVIALLLSGCGSSASRVETLKNWSFQYNEGTSDYSLFFGLADKNDKSLSADVDVDIRIVNDADEEVYAGTKSISPDDFSYYTSQAAGEQDLKGMKIRVIPSQIFIETMSAMGATPSPMGWSEVVTSLITKMIDGTGMPFSNIVDTGLHEIEGYCIMTGHNPTLSGVFINEASWNKLSEDDQKILEQAGVEARQAVYESFSANEEAARAAIAEKGMVIIEKDELSFDTDAIRDSVAEKFKDDWGDIFQEIMEYLGKA